MASYYGIGLLSGPSKDGLHICYAEFMGDISTDVWSYRIIKTEVHEYTEAMLQQIENAHKLSGQDLLKLHAQYGHYLGKVVKEFVKGDGDEDLRLDFVASHGHTIFHQPENGFTFQLGDAETVVTYLRCPLVANFHNKDVALGGQGAPLVTIGESILFSAYDACLNLGGVSTVSSGGKSFDVGPCNMVLNELAHRHNGSRMDRDGTIAAGGKMMPELLNALKELPYFHEPPPKSMSREWYDSNFLPLLNSQKYTVSDLLRTVVEVIAETCLQACVRYNSTFLRPIVRRHSISEQPKKSVLITGGGALNKFLFSEIKAKLTHNNFNVVQMDGATTVFKETLIYTFFGLRCLLGLTNVNSVMTGARADSISGSIHLPVMHTPLSPSVRSRYNMDEKKIGFDWVRDSI